MSKIVIIGNGIAGITAARHIRKLGDNDITVISAESKYFFSRTALMYVFMGHMKFEHIQPYENWFWRKNKIDLLQAKVKKLEPGQNHLILDSDEIISYNKLILAIGSKPRAMPIEGYKLPGVQSLYSKQDLQLMEKNVEGVKQATVVGGGLIGIEMAEMLHTRGVHVSLIVRENSYWDMVLPKEESEMVNRHIISRGIDLRLGQSIEKIIGEDKVEKLLLTNGDELNCQMLGITIGVEPNISLLSGLNIDLNKGVLVDETLKTSIDNIYAVGDCAELRNPPDGRSAIEPIWYSGRMMGETVANTVCGEDNIYNPGIWFNSAKFFDLEYQTYGNVPVNAEDGIDSFFWEDVKHEKSIRLVYNKQKSIVGIVSLGVRLRHEICDIWISKEASLTFALANLDKINFDPEFYNKFEKEVVLSY